MEQQSRKTKLLFWPALLLYISVSSVLASPSTAHINVAQSILPTSDTFFNSMTGSNNNFKYTINRSQSKEFSVEWIQQITLIFPRLERALIIITIINFIVIIFVFLLYIFKRKMTQFSASPMGNIKVKSQAKNDFLDSLHNETS